MSKAKGLSLPKLKNTKCYTGLAAFSLYKKLSQEQMVNTVNTNDKRFNLNGRKNRLEST